MPRRSASRVAQGVRGLLSRELRLRLSTALLAALFLTACPTKESSESKPAECKKFGATCQFAPGKLGTCVVKEPCPSGDCFVCQSQH